MRLSQLKDVLFPVEEYPVFVAVPDESGERRLPAQARRPSSISRANVSLGWSVAIIGW